ncbi:MAG: hypothetical protein HUU02_09620 [Bacteroidetes bacterium]|nr:hypothetical protein [Bacteroidota bacterium]
MMRSSFGPYRTVAVVTALLLILLPGILGAQLRSITAFTDYSLATGKRMNVETASAVGGGTQVRFGLSEEFAVGFSLGYKLYSLSQKDQLTAWNWDFWNNRYSITIRSNILADPNLSVQVGSVQKIDMVPAALTADHTLALSDDLHLISSLSAGAVFFSRRMFIVETWTKRFPAADHVFTYSYRNFAPNKKGSVLLASPGVTARYRLFESAELTAGARFTQYFIVDGLVGSQEFPFDNDINLTIGLDFAY